MVYMDMKKYKSTGTVCIISICTLYMVYMDRKYIIVQELFV